jgi:hypothetical protein
MDKIAIKFPDNLTPTDPPPHTQTHLGGGIGGTSLPEWGERQGSQSPGLPVSALCAKCSATGRNSTLTFNAVA